MKIYSRMNGSLSGVIFGLVLLALLVMTPVVAHSGSRLAANVSTTGVEITADVTGAEIISVDVAGPDSVVEHTESTESPFMISASGSPDGSYQYEVQLLDSASGNILDRLTGNFTVQYGQVVLPGKGERAEGFSPTMKVLGRFVNAVLDFLTPEAEAADLTVSSGIPTLHYDDTDTATNPDWDLQSGQYSFSVGCGTTNTNFNYYDYQGGTRNVLTLCSSTNNARSLEVDGSGNIHLANDGVFINRSAKYLGVNLTTPGTVVDTIGNQIRLRNSTLSTAKSIAMRVDGSAIDLDARNADLWVRADLGSTSRNIYMLSTYLGVGTVAPNLDIHVAKTRNGVVGFRVENPDVSVAGFPNAQEQFVLGPSGTEHLIFQVLSPSHPTYPNTTLLNAVTTNFYFRTNGFNVFKIIKSGAVGDTLVLNGGKVGILRASPAYPLDVNGSVRATAYYYTSSRTLKDNIVDLKPTEAMAALEELNPVKFNFKTDPDVSHIGFIAEDVPNLVSQKNRDTIDPMDIVAVLTRVAQEQNKTIQEQNKAIAELSGKLNKLEAQVTRIKSKDVFGSVDPSISSGN